MRREDGHWLLLSELHQFDGDTARRFATMCELGAVLTSTTRSSCRPHIRRSSLRDPDACSMRYQVVEVLCQGSEREHRVM